MNNQLDFCESKMEKVFWITQPFIQKTMMWLKKLQKNTKIEEIKDSDIETISKELNCYFNSKRYNYRTFKTRLRCKKRIQ